MNRRSLYPRRVFSSTSGFTLIELLISITIFALLITVLYQAFSTASRVWSRQELFDESKARQVAIRRMFEADFNQLVSYSYRHPKGEYTFFAGTPTVLFYAIRGGFGVHYRDQHGLFFVCCYLQPENDGIQSLMIYKSAFPEQKMLTAFEDFIGLDSAEQKTWIPPEELGADSLKVITGIKQAQFYYQQMKNFSVANDIEDADADETATEEQKWRIQRDFPEILRFSYKFQERWSHHYIHLDPLPDPAAKSQNDAEAKK